MVCTSGSGLDEKLQSATELSDPEYEPLPVWLIIMFWCLTCIWIAILTAFAGLVGSVLVPYLIYFPKDPKIWVESSAVFSLNVIQSELNSTWNFTLLVMNPSANPKVGIYFSGGVQVSLFHGDMEEQTMKKVMLATKPLPPPSSIHSNNQTSIRFKLATRRAYVDHDVTTKILQGKARFGLELVAIWRYTTPWLSGSNYLRLYCDPVQPGFPNNGTGTLTGQPSECKVDRTPSQYSY